MKRRDAREKLDMKPASQRASFGLRLGNKKHVREGSRVKHASTAGSLAVIAVDSKEKSEKIPLARRCAYYRSCMHGETMCHSAT